MVATELRVQPDDAHNRALVDDVHPSQWTNPTPDGKYNLVVIGAGTAGLVCAAGTAGMGGKVALIEKHMMGGDCLVTGCVPSKAIIRSGHLAALARDGSTYGFDAGNVEVDFPAVMERMRRLRAQISPNDSAARFRDLGVDVFLGEGKFVSRNTVEVDGVALKFARAVVATGASAWAPPIAGLADAGYLTNEGIFELTELPKRLVVIGGGPIGSELGQTFARLGSQVTIVDQANQLLGKDDADAAAIIATSLERDGIELVLGATIDQVTSDRTVMVTVAGRQRELPADQILVATGRRPNVTGLGLDVAGVQVDNGRIVVDKKLRTTNKKIFAAGDVASPLQFTHAADAMARIVIRNALFFGRSKVDSLIVPRVTYTSPELAQVGITAAEAGAQGIAIDTFEQQLEHVDRAIVDGATTGFVRVHVARGSDKIVGATIVGQHAGEIIGELVLAMTAGVGLGTIGAAIHAYPTQSMAIKQVADAYGRTRLTPRLSRFFGWLLRRRRS